jgi:hypothetical protein
LRNAELPLRVSSRRLNLPRFTVLLFLFSICGMGQQAWALPQSTTTLTERSGGIAVTTVTSGSVLTLQATVSAAGAPVTPGQVAFCDASATYCSDIHLLGIAQLTSNGTATLKFVPGIGSHHYKAVFLGRFGGTSSIAGSTSTVAALTVTGSFLTSTSITSSGNAGSYSLTATVTAIVNSSASTSPAGSVSFLDTTNNNYSLMTTAMVPGAFSLNFLNSSNPPTVSEPNVVAAADFNGDGRPDIAVSNSNSGGTLLSVLLGNGDGTFTATTASPTVGLYPDSIVVADFNADGIPDLALTSVDQNLVTILLGNGDGTFKSSPNLNTLSTPQSVATGDFNGDGIADLAVVNANSVLVFLGNGDGTFTVSPTSSPTGMSPVTVAAADFNGDGIPDLAVVNSCGPSYPCDNDHGTVTILIGKGDGTFTTAAASPEAGPSTVGLVVADFNGDGKLDLAVSNYGNDSIGAATIFLGNGDGTFHAGVNLAQGYDARQLVVGDFNCDGIPDLAIAYFWNGTMTIVPGNGDGTFATPIITSSYAFLSSGYFASADFNGDGVPDLAIPDQNPDGTVAIALTQPNQTATASVTGISPVGAGSHLVDAVYSASGAYAASTSGTASLTAEPLATTLSFTANPAASSYGQQVMLTATLAPYSGQNHTTDTEGIAIYSGSTVVGTAPLSSGVSTLNITSLPSGPYSLTASFAGDTNFLASNSAAVPFSVTKATPTIGLTAAPNPVALQSTATLTATVSSVVGTPTGSVVFSDGSTSLGTVPLSNGLATLNVSTLVAGTHSLTAAYGGDNNFASLTSSPVAEIVQNFALSIDSSAKSQTVSPGGTASYNLLVNPLGVNAFQNAISFTASGLPAGATATFSPQSISAGSAGTNVTLTVMVPQQTALLKRATTNYPAMALLGVGLLMLPFWSSRRKLADPYKCRMILCGVMLIGLIGCGGSGNGSITPPPQTYTITVTATSNSLSETEPVTLIVQ